MLPLRKTRMPLALLLVAMLMVTAVPVALADGHEGDEMVDLTVMHRINGQRIGLDRELPVDVCVNGGYAFTFEFPDKVDTELPEGEYQFDVFLADGGSCSGDPVMSAGPAYLGAGAKVKAMAMLDGGAPVLRVQFLDD